jgi:hypothetical protein
VHLIRNSLDYASWKDRKLLAAAIKPIYTAASAEAAEAELAAFAQGPWGTKFPTVVAAWRRAWDRVIPFFAFPPSIRRVIYTTNAIESINAQLRKIIKSRGHFPSDDAASKLIWLALRNITADWGRAAHNWKEAMNQFAILYKERFTCGPRQRKIRKLSMSTSLNRAPPAAWQGPEDIREISRGKFTNRLEHKNPDSSSVRACLDVGFRRPLTLGGCGRKLGLPGGSSCIPTKIGFERLSSTSSLANASDPLSVSWVIQRKIL